MAKRSQSRSTEDTAAAADVYIFRLFVAGNEPRSAEAIRNLSQICQAHLNGRSRVEIIDVLDDFEAALRERVVVTPTLIVDSPPPRITLVGTLADHAKVRAALRLFEGES